MEQPRILVTRQFTKNGEIKREDDDAENVSVPVMDERAAIAKVTYSAGATLNMGNYESAKIAVGIELPCYVAEIDEAYKTAIKLVESTLQPEINDVREYIESRKGGS
jgi:hypothetical protein